MPSFILPQAYNSLQHKGELLVQFVPPERTLRKIKYVDRIK